MHDEVKHARAACSPAREEFDEVVLLPCGPEAPLAGDHNLQTYASVAQAIAVVLGRPFGGTVNHVNDLPQIGRHGRRFFVPSHTLSTEQARRLGITRPSQFFGGIVPHPFVATKVISHRLVSEGAVRPQGWSTAHFELLQGAVLAGYSVFSRADALIAGARLLEQGPVRVKEPEGIGGSGQHVVEDGATLQACVEGIGEEQIAREGLVLEPNLEAIRTLTVGQIQVGELRAAYVGTQTQTQNGRAQTVYGGSSLHVVRGGMDSLAGLALGLEESVAIERSMRYHRASHQCYPGLLASRCNYDVATGRAHGKAMMGVLEQSWRIGGASGAELAALHRLHKTPALRSVRCATHEIHDAAAELPKGAWVTFDGADSNGHRLIKYVEVEADEYV